MAKTEATDRRSFGPRGPGGSYRLKATTAGCLVLCLGVFSIGRARADRAEADRGDLKSQKIEGEAAAEPLSTAAVFDDPTGRNLLLARLAFDELDLKMVGMAVFLGRPSVFIEQDGIEDQVIYEEGGAIGGFTILSIQPEYTVFEKNGIRLWLAMEKTPASEAAPASRLPAPEELLLEVIHKQRALGTKIKTKAYAAVHIIESVVDTVMARAAGTIGKSTQGIASATLWRPSNQTPALRTPTPRGRFLWPLTGRLTSGFGYRKKPIGGARKYHQGIDIAAPRRSPIRAAAAGRVIKVSRSWAKGLYVKIRHDETYTTAYFHLDNVLVHRGQWVIQAETVGLEGSSGRSTGPHLHFEIHKNGQPVDPTFYLPEFTPPPLGE